MATAVNVVMRYGPLQWILFYAVGHCNKFGYGLWVTAGNEADSQICGGFLAMSPNAEFGSVLKAIAPSQLP
jgi:hypothetical protein